MNQSRRIAEAKRSVIEMYDSGYVTPVMRKDVKVFGRSALGALYAGINGMWLGGYATEHDALVGQKAGLCNVRRRPQRTNHGIGTIFAGSRKAGLPFASVANAKHWSAFKAY